MDNKTAMAFEEAYDKFMEWYDACINAGIEPEDVVANVGGMMLITDEEQIEKISEFLGEEEQ